MGADGIGGKVRDEPRGAPSRAATGIAGRPSDAGLPRPWVLTRRTNPFIYGIEGAFTRWGFERGRRGRRVPF